MRRAIAFIHERFPDVPCVEQVAAEVGLSRTAFFAQFRQSVGVAPQAYVDALRLELATRMLAGTGASIAEVSDATGFSAPTHFTRFFVRHAGLRPSEYRRQAAAPPAPGEHRCAACGHGLASPLYFTIQTPWLLSVT